MKVAIIQYSSGNVASVDFALRRCGVEGIVTANHKTIMESDKVILPGVGAAGAAMASLRSTGLDKLIPTLEQPVLGICLGMQLLCYYSQEDKTYCTGIVKQSVRRFPGTLKVPKTGWGGINDLRTPLFSGINEQSFMYFVHSYSVPLCEETIATAGYNGKYSAAIKKDNFYGVQFHPEKSAEAGHQLLQNFISL